MKLRIFTLVATIVGGISLIAGVIAHIFQDELKYSLFKSFYPAFWLSVFLSVLGATLLILAFCCLFFAKTVRSSCGLMTSSLSLGISAAGSLGVCCVMIWLGTVKYGNPSAYPIEYPASITIGIVAFFVFIALSMTYLFLRSKKWSGWGFLFDALTVIMFSPAIFCAITFAYSLLDTVGV